MSRSRKRKSIFRLDTLLITLVIAIITLLTHYYNVGSLPVALEKTLQGFEQLSQEEEYDYIRTKGTPLGKDSGMLEARSTLSSKDNPPAKQAWNKDTDALRFMMYNVENYFVYGEPSRCKYILKLKSEDSRNALVEVITKVNPDVLGLIEMGGELALEDLRKRLKKNGCDYPYYRILERMGEPRAVALLSKHPIIHDESRAHYSLHDNRKRRMLRGILDLEIELDDGRKFCIVGTHLKSRVSTDPAAATSLRSQEARTLAMHLHQRMKKSPNLPILVFGDWNDTPSDPSLGILSQGISANSALNLLPAKDSEGASWTYYYSKGKQYYIFDQIYANNVLKARLKSPLTSGLMNSSKASDHRAVWCEIR